VNSLSESAIQDGYWYHQREPRFPPDAIRDPEQYDGGDRICVWCTQTSLPASKQRKLVARWIELLPTLEGVNTLWFTSKVPQTLFAAACKMANLQGLYIKWSSIDDLAPIREARALRFFHLGSSTRLPSIEPLSTRENLLWLELENINRVSGISSISSLRSLVGLAIEGSTWTTQRISTLAPLERLTDLRYLSLINTKVADCSLRPLHSLSQLRTFRHALWWTDAELGSLYAALPQLQRWA
jgi:hypothetical protein